MRWFLIVVFIYLVISSVQSQPGPRHLEDVAYDTKRQRLILFGGIELQKEHWIEPSSVHEWDGLKWTVSQAAGPTGRRACALVYNESTQETFLFGGVSTGKIQPDSVLLDAWKWNGKSWKIIKTTCPVKEPAAIYDPVNKRILVYGDANNKTAGDNKLPAIFELWAFKDDRWEKLAADGPNTTGSRKICYDVARKKLVVPVFHDNKLFVWEWSDGAWTKTEIDKDCPGYRSRFALAYHPVERATYLFGGLSAQRKELSDLWKWDGRQWSKIDFTGGPSARNSAHFVFGNSELLLYGGTAPKSPPEKGSYLSNELWGWKKGGWEQYNNNDLARTGIPFVQGKYLVGFKTIRLRTSANKPMLISLWYPAESKTDLIARSDVIKSGKIKISDTDSSMVADFKGPMKRIFNIDINDSLYDQAIKSKTKSFDGPKIRNGKYPLVIATATPAGYFDSFEFFASHGFVVAGVTSIYEESPPGPAHYKQFTDLLDELLQYMVKQKYVLATNISAFGHGGGIQFAMYLAMRRNQIKKVINLDGGFFSPRSNTTASSDYHPERFRIPLLHIVTVAQNKEDDVQQFNAIKSPVLKVSIKSDSVWHHDFTGWGTLVGRVLNQRASLGTINEVVNIVHDTMLKFLLNQPIKEADNTYVRIERFND